MYDLEGFISIKLLGQKLLAYNHILLIKSSELRKDQHEGGWELDLCAYSKLGHMLVDT